MFGWTSQNFKSWSHRSILLRRLNWTSFPDVSCSATSAFSSSLLRRSRSQASEGKKTKMSRARKRWPSSFEGCPSCRGGGRANWVRFHSVLFCNQGKNHLRHWSPIKMLQVPKVSQIEKEGWGGRKKRVWKCFGFSSSCCRQSLSTSVANRNLLIARLRWQFFNLFCCKSFYRKR